MANEEHVKVLKQGVRIWNKWREDNPDIQPDLNMADFSRADFSEADLSRVDLSKAKLIKARLRGTNLRGADLRWADLSEADLGGAKLNEAKLNWADLIGAKLDVADLRKTVLSGANLSRANLRKANLKDAELVNADLKGVNLADGQNVHFDGNQLRETIISPTTTGPWLTLRRRYTGTKFFLHLCLLIAFILPYAGKALFWTAVHKSEKVALKRMQQIKSDLGGDIEINVRYYKPEKPVSGQLQAVSNTKPLKLKVADLYNKIEDNTETLSVWKVLLGLDRNMWYPATAVILIFYNVLRLNLTLSVSELNDEQIRTGYAPRLAKEWAWKERLSFLVAKPAGYGPLIWPGHIASALFWASFVIFAFHFKDWLTAEVYVWASQ